MVKIRPVLLLLVSTTLFSCAAVQAKGEPVGKDECLAQGGAWGAFGLLIQEQCNLPTSDAGNSCLDSEECQGACIAELTPGQQARVTGGQPVEVTGTCSKQTLNFGCYPFVKQGFVRGILCVD